jgi:hypothetical protein
MHGHCHGSSTGFMLSPERGSLGTAHEEGRKPGRQQASVPADQVDSGRVGAGFDPLVISALKFSLIEFCCMEVFFSE